MQLIRAVSATIVVSISTVSFAADGYLAQPALFGDRLVFVSERDLWTARIPTDANAPMRTGACRAALTGTVSPSGSPAW